MNNYVSIALKIIGSLIILYIIFLIIVLCINTDNLKIKNSDKRKISEKYKKMKRNKMSEKLISYGKKIGEKMTFSTKKK